MVYAGRHSAHYGGFRLVVGFHDDLNYVSRKVCVALPPLRKSRSVVEIDAGQIGQMWETLGWNEMHVRHGLLVRYATHFLCVVLHVVQFSFASPSRRAEKVYERQRFLYLLSPGSLIPFTLIPWNCRLKPWHPQTADLARLSQDSVFS